MTIALAAAIVLAALFLTLYIRSKDVPEPEPVSPVQHLDDRKTAIYENLRDLLFEYRLGKLSDEDYRSTKLNLQKELASVLAEIDAITRNLGLSVKQITQPRKAKTAPGIRCPHCGATFAANMKFCGECGKAMAS